MNHPIPTSYANAILGFLGYLDDDEDAQEFVRLAVKAQEWKAHINDQPYNSHDVLSLICAAKTHRWEDRPDMIDDVKDERYMRCRICGEVRRHEGNV